MRRISIELEVPWTVAGVRCAVGALTAANVLLMQEWARQGRTVPRLYTSGVRYKRQPRTASRPREQFKTFPSVLASGFGDCDQLASWLAAERRVRDGIHARAVPRRIRDDLMHVVVLHPSGRVEDPSKRLGMGRRKRG